VQTLWDLIEPAARMLLPGLSRPLKVPGASPAPVAMPPASSSPQSPAQAVTTTPPLPLVAPRAIAPPRVATRRKRPETDVSACAPALVPSPVPSPPPASPARAESAQEAYDRVVQHMLTTHKIRVRRWRTAMSGVAWYVEYRDGTIARLLESPKPKGPMSMAVFLHEVGHHAIGFDRYKPRCLEEYHAWRWSLEAMQAHNLNITESVRYRMHLSLWYAVSKARRRGLKVLPPELAPFTERPKKIKATDRAESRKSSTRRAATPMPPRVSSTDD